MPLFKPISFIFLALLCLTTVAWADTLETGDGRLIEGRYLGGSQGSIRFEVNGRVKVFPVADVLALTFGTRPPAAGRTGPHPAPEAPPRPPTPGFRAKTKVTLAAGTRFNVRLEEDLGTDEKKSGDPFTARLNHDLKISPTITLPKDTLFRGKVAHLRAVGRVAGGAELLLELTAVEVDDHSVGLITDRLDIRNNGRFEMTRVSPKPNKDKTGDHRAGPGPTVVRKVPVTPKPAREKHIRLPAGATLEFRLRRPVTFALEQ